MMRDIKFKTIILWSNKGGYHNSAIVTGVNITLPAFLLICGDQWKDPSTSIEVSYGETDSVKNVS